MQKQIEIRLNGEDYVCIRKEDYKMLFRILSQSSEVLSDGKEPKFKLGQEYLGGIIFHIDESGEHGLVADKQDHPEELSWNDAMKLYRHTQWRLPTKEELNLLYEQKDIVGGFAAYGYWSSSENGSYGAWGQGFSNGYQYGSNSKNYAYYVRAVRAF